MFCPAVGTHDAKKTGCTVRLQLLTILARSWGALLLLPTEPATVATAAAVLAGTCCVRAERTYAAKRSG
jgi:hypothetical protein